MDLNTCTQIIMGSSYTNFVHYLPANYKERTVIIIDDTVNKLYGSVFTKPFKVFEIGKGESIKTQTTIDNLIIRFLQSGIDRNCFVIGIGGGVVCDITGYIASIYMRGLHYAYIPTTFLSQVDAAIGGKNGINYNGLKNVIGTINSPDFVLIDTCFVNTLPKVEIKNGLIEIIKHAIIKDSRLFSFIEQNIDKVLNKERVVIHYLVQKSITIKNQIVKEDPYEENQRKVLNLGHTFGHAIESLTDLSHGQAVGIGLIITAELSYQLGYTKKKTITRIKKLIHQIQFPTTIPLSLEVLFNKIKSDKKSKGIEIDYIIIKDIGEVCIETISFFELEKITKTFFLKNSSRIKN